MPFVILIEIKSLFFLVLSYINLLFRCVLFAMKRFFVLLFFSFSLCADFQMQQNIFFTIEPFNHIGQIIGPAPVFYFTGKGISPSVISIYSIANNGVNKKVCGFLDKNMPAGTHLFVNLSPPAGARSMGTQELSATPVDLVIELSQVAETELPVVYTFQADPSAGVIYGASRIVFFTFTDG